MRVGQQYEEPDDAMPEGMQAPDEPLERPLAAFSDDEIFAELELRFQAFCFTGESYHADDRTRQANRYHGRMNVLIGLATQILWDLQRQAF